MNWSDAVNGLWELAGAAFTCLNIRTIYLDREVKGFHPAPLAFFTAWGYWNCLFYPDNGLLLSFAGGAVLALANTAYATMVVYYRYARPWFDLMNWLGIGKK